MATFLMLACGSPLHAQGVFFGDSLAVGEGMIRTWVEVDSDNAPVRIGVTVTANVLPQLPVTERDWSLHFPTVASDSLFTHLLFNWNPLGHPPVNVYGAPHFDFHFYVVSRSQRRAVIEGPDFEPVAAQHLPPNYRSDFTPPFAVGNMGAHYVDISAPEWTGGTFTRTMIYGFYQADLFFIEPMVSRAYLETNPSDTLAIKQPQAYQRPGYYPTTYTLTYDADAEAYEVSLINFVFRQTTSTAIEGVDDVPEAFSLAQNYPNPFNPNTNIRYTLPQRSNVRLVVFDALGRELTTLVQADQPAGTYTVRWNAGSAPSGVYYYRLQASDFIATRQLLLVK